MRVLIAATMAASLFATNLLAAETVKPLAPGKAAGVQQAQDFNYNLLWWGLGLGVVAAGLAAGTGQGGNAALPVATSGIVTPTTGT